MGTSSLCLLLGISFLLEIRLFLLVLKKNLDMLHCGIIKSLLVNIV